MYCGHISSCSLDTGSYKPLYSNAKLIAFWKNACILHDTGLEFCQTTVSSIKRMVQLYILTGKVPQYTPNSW